MSSPFASWTRAGGWLACCVGLAATELPAGTNVTSWLKVSRSSNDGLPNNTVGGLAQTPDGFLWLGMPPPSGLARFDGVQFEEFAMTNLIAPPNRGILTMTSGRDGALWLAMDRGAVVGVNGRKVFKFTPAPQQSNLTINSLTEDAEHAIWIAYRGGSVRRLRITDAPVLEEMPGLPGGLAICALACDARGRLWFSKAGHLGVFREGRFVTLTNVPAAAARLCPARDGGVWLCAGFRLFKYTEGGELRSFGEFSPRRAGTEPSDLLESGDGAVWVGTTFSGVFRFNGASFESVPTSHQEILTLLEDVEGNIWVGTAGGGLDQVRPRTVTLETAEKGLPFEAVQSLCEDSQRTVWAATQNGSLARLVNGNWLAFTNDAAWAGDATSLCADTNGNVWIGTRYHRLQCWRAGGFVNWGDNAQVIGQTIHTLVAARNGDLWIGEDTPTAVQCLRQGRLVNFELPPDFRVIRASAEDAAGRIWFGASRGVLLRVEGDRLVDETARTTGVPQPIRYLYATPDGALWIAYAGSGVGRFKDGQFALITARQGLHDDFVSQIVADDRGWLWFGCNRGIFKVRQQELEAVAEGRAARVRSIYYGPGDGLPSLQANFGNSPIALRTDDGRLWLAMRTALAVIDPSIQRENSPVPPVLLRRMAVGDRTVAAYGGVVPVPMEKGLVPLDLAGTTNTLTVAPDHRRVEFDFTALSFVQPENLNFRYRLDGFEEDWSEAGTERRAVYPRLAPGPYTFAVQACNAEGVWGERAAGVSFEVTPFFWQTWWFRGAAFAGFTALVIGAVRYVSFRRLRVQLRQLEAQAALHKERARIAKDIHDDLGANLTQISLIGELARQDREQPEKVGDHLEKISGAARQAVKSLDEIVWAVNPRNDTLAHFIDYTGQFALDYLRLAGLRCRLDLPDQVPARELSTDLRHNLFLVVKEAINNTVKHAHATELRLQVTVTDEKLVIVIEDDGGGFEPPPDDATADGLRNMRQRLADIGGVCGIQGRPGAGTKVSIELPWRPGAAQA